MADQAALKLLGLACGAVAAAVALTAFMMVLRDVQSGTVYDATVPRAAVASAG